jgi:hypothetical protein
VRSRVSREYAHEDVGWFRCLQEALLYYVLLYSKEAFIYCTTIVRSFTVVHVTAFAMDTFHVTL